MHINNYVPTIVEKSARRATRIVCGGPRAMTYYKAIVHRAYRRYVKNQMYGILNGRIDPLEYEDVAIGSRRCTSWDIA